ncbi:MAG: DUF1549 domain-containing protein, partial [Planctomycetia bacterium]|nr:DUF1549 domain-containing protein [Planctomycetia bacterium]
AFLADVKERGLEAAYERAVDRLLRSPRYGEQMAWHWLEAARYADTDGYQNDGPREMWRWRDWIIEAFNRNMPFDQFTIEQLAGDLLPNPTQEQLIATAFNRNNRYNSEEGIPIDEFHLSLTKPALYYGVDHYFSFDVEDENVKASHGYPLLEDSPHGKAAFVGDGSSFEVGKIPGLIGNGRFSLSFCMKPEQVDKGPVLSNEMPGTGRNGILIEFVNGRLRWNINTRWISGVSTVETVRKFQPSEWVHITLTNDGTQRAAGMLMYVNGELQDVAVVRNTNSNKAKRDDGAAMNVGYSKHVGFWKGYVDELRFYSQRTLSPREAALLAVPESLSELTALPEPKRSQLQRELLRTAFLEQAAEQKQARLLADVRQAEAQWEKYYDGLP